MYLKSLVIGLCLIISSSAFANFSVRIPTPVVIYGDRTISIPFNERRYNGPNTMVSIEVDNSKSINDLYISNLTVVSEIDGLDYKLFKYVDLHSNFFDFATHRVELVSPNLLVPAGKIQKIGCETCMLIFGDLYDGEDYLQGQSVKSLEFNFKGWFESKGIPVKNATYTVKTGVIE